MPTQNQRKDESEAHIYSEEEVDEWFETESETDSKDRKLMSISDKFRSAQLRVVRSTMDLSIHNLRTSLSDPSYINLNPSYQRRQRWDTKKKSQLIESLLLNIPVPPVFLYENEYNTYEIMDGRQRLESIRDYLENRYPLRGLEYWPELNGERFNTLPDIIQKGLLRRTISAMVLLAETTSPEESEFDVRMALFKRLNTGGVKLNPQELRNALYPSLFNDMILSLSEHDIFRDVWGIPRHDKASDVISKSLQENTLYKTMADCDLVLRFFAIKETITCGRRGALQTLMNTCLRKHATDDEKAVEAYSNEYVSILGFHHEVFKGRPFHLPQTNRVSRPVYDALMVATSIVGLDDIRERGDSIRANYLREVQKQDSYEVLVGRGNTVESIIHRVDLAIQILTA